MEKKMMVWKTKGMNRDLSVSAFNPEFAFENMNLRLATNEGNTMLSWVNEKGTREVEVIVNVTPWTTPTYNRGINGVPIGTAILDHHLVIFTHPLYGSSGDYIYSLEWDKTALSGQGALKGTLLFQGNLSFDLAHPLETLVSYESSEVQKVYWTDGVNQPRMINIAKEITGDAMYNNSSFDFVNELQLKEKVYVEKLIGVNGMFPSGVIQYAFTYYNKYGQESNIFYISPLLYVSPKDRGAAPDEKVDNAFKITVETVDENFDYIRIYSIQRTSLNGTPICKRVQDIEIDGLSYTLIDKNGEDEPSNREYNASYTDYGTSGDTVDPYELLYKGGESVVVETMEQKDETLFMGNIQVKNPSMQGLKDEVERGVEEEKVKILEDEKTLVLTHHSFGDYSYENQLSCFNKKTERTVPCGGFKTGNTYRLGVQFQDKTGKWSDPIFLEDKPVTNKPEYKEEQHKIKQPRFVGRIDKDTAESIMELGYRKVRSLMAIPSPQDRAVICQGVGCPTLYTNNHRTYPDPENPEKTLGNNDLYAQSSWFFRAATKGTGDIDVNGGGNKYIKTVGEEEEYLNDLHFWTVPESEDIEELPEPEEITAAIEEKVGTEYAVMYQSGETIVSNYYYIEDATVSPYKIKIVGWASSIGQTGRLTVLDNETGGTGTVAPTNKNNLEYTQRNIKEDTPDSGNAYVPTKIRQVEVEGDFKDSNQFKIDWYFNTLHSPDFVFDDQTFNTDFNVASCYKVGKAIFSKTFSSINIQTETPAIAGNAGGFDARSFIGENVHGIVSGLFYEDGTVEDVKRNPPLIRRLHEGGEDSTKPEPCPNRWLVYPWQGSGSLNNDINRGTGQGTPSAVLKKKVISNLRYADTTWEEQEGEPEDLLLQDSNPQLFYSDEPTIIKLGDSKVYQGNIDTMLLPDNYDGKYFAFNSSDIMAPGIVTPFDSVDWWKTFNEKDAQVSNPGLYKWDKNNSWIREGLEEQRLGDQVLELVMKRNPVRLKYKSTPHVVFETSESIRGGDDYSLPILEMRKVINSGDIYGGKSEDALKANVWIPCGEAKRLDDYEKNDQDVELPYILFNYNYGDTYYQRWDCLKTYPFTREDVNQVVEIGSFMLETYVNIDGRYDRNRGQINNTNMSPQNFNLLNPVYSQLNNFFTYRIQDEDAYKETSYPNQITWSKTKTSGADVDAWTNVTLASTLELDGDKGEITKLIQLNDLLLAFQDKGIAQIIYNPNVQISTQNGIPVEIANSGKVEGKRYLSNTVGCSNKWSMTTTSMGIYFMDSNEKSIYRFGEGLVNLSQQGGFNAWCKHNIPESDIKWNPVNFGDNEKAGAFVTYYDKANQDVLFINKENALAFSEKIGAFTSFYDYGSAPYFCQLDGMGFWLNSSRNPGDITCRCWMHQQGDYCEFFNQQRPYWMTLVGNPDPLLDKTFTNLEFRACVENDGSIPDDPDKKWFNFYLPFDSLEAWDEYQHGLTALSDKKNRQEAVHGTNDSALKRKFRIWRCDIPRDNFVISAPETASTEDKEVAALNKEKDIALGISRTRQHPLDRMRNPWVYLKLQKDSDTSKKAEIHDMVMTYFA